MAPDIAAKIFPHGLFIQIPNILRHGLGYLPGQINRHLFQVQLNGGTAYPGLDPKGNQDTQN
jgi:hypothetical protein